MNQIQQWIVYYNYILALLKALGFSVPLPPLPVMQIAGATDVAPPDLTPAQQQQIVQSILAAHIAGTLL